jgi:hypothetical protein
MRIHGVIRPLNKIGFKHPMIANSWTTKPQNCGTTFAFGAYRKLCGILFGIFQGVRLVSQK